MDKILLLGGTAVPIPMTVTHLTSTKEHPEEADLPWQGPSVPLKVSSLVSQPCHIPPAVPALSSYPADPILAPSS